MDFWLDVQQHENMCKAYFKVSADSKFRALLKAATHTSVSELTCMPDLQDLRRSGRAIQEDWPEFAIYARTNGSHFAPLLTPPSEPSTPILPDSLGRTPDPMGPSPMPITRSTSPLGSPLMRDRRDTESLGPRTAFSPVMPEETHRDRPGMAPSGRMNGKRGRSERRSKAPTVIARDRAIEKAALVEGAERIYLRYLLPGAEREIYLP